MSCDLKIWPGIRLSLLTNIRVYCLEKESQVIDISSIGTHIILYKGDKQQEIEAVLKMKLIFENGEIDKESKILRK